MKTTTLILLTMLSISSQSQNSKTIEGYYDLSEFEMPAHLYLLDNNTFHYYAIFGSVDLEIYGKYTIKDNELSFQPNEDQIQPFILYSIKNKELKDTIVFNYYKPDEDGRFKVVFSVDEQWVKSPLNEMEDNGISFKIKKEDVKSLKIGYPAYYDKAGGFIQVLDISVAAIPSNQNDFILSYNRFYSMRKDFSKTKMQLDGDTLVSSEKKLRISPLLDGDKQKINAFLKEDKMFESYIVNDDQIYQRINLEIENRKPKLIRKDSINLELMLTYDKKGNKVENGDFFYDNEQLKEIITYENEAKFGQRKWLYENGQVQEEGKYNEYGLKDGDWEAYFENGQLFYKATYKDGLSHGKWKSHFVNGQIKEEGIYKNDEKEGEWKSYYKNGNPKEIEIYKNGSRAGESKEYHENGQLKVVHTYKGYVEIGKYEYYNEDGQLISIGSYDENGKQTGECKSYYSNGQLSLVITYENGKPVGEQKSFYEDGELAELRVHTNNVTTLKSYYKNGQLKKIGTLLYDEFSGEWKEYYDNGALKIVGSYTKNGKSNGVWKYYYEKGKIKEIHNYQDGEFVGEYNSYSESGQLMEIGNYKNGEPSGEWKYYHENGQLRKAGERTRFDDIGEWKFYDENGKLIITDKE